MTEIQPFSPQDFGLKESSVEYTPPHGYKKIIVPTNGIDIDFNKKVAEIMQLSFQQPSDNMILTHMVSNLYSQMGGIYSNNFVEFMANLQGNGTEQGNSPGYPQVAGLDIVEITNEQWSLLVMAFRHTAMLFYNAVSKYSQFYVMKNIELVFNSYISAGWVFVMAPRRFYDL